MKSIFGRGQNLLPDVKRGSAKALWDLFVLRTTDYLYEPWYEKNNTRNVFKDFYIESEYAYALIGEAADIAAVQSDPNKNISALHLLMHLVRSAATTQMPEELKHQMSAIEGKVVAFGHPEGEKCWNDLKRWYRLAPFA